MCVCVCVCVCRGYYELRNGRISLYRNSILYRWISRGSFKKLIPAILWQPSIYRSIANTRLLAHNASVLDTDLQSYLAFEILQLVFLRSSCRKDIIRPFRTKTLKTLILKKCHYISFLRASVSTQTKTNFGEIRNVCYNRCIKYICISIFTLLSFFMMTVRYSTQTILSLILFQSKNKLEN